MVVSQARLTSLKGKDLGNWVYTLYPTGVLNYVLLTPEILITKCARPSKSTAEVLILTVPAVAGNTVSWLSAAVFNTVIATQTVK